MRPAEQAISVPENHENASITRKDLRTAVHLLAGSTAAAIELGETFLEGRARAIWRKALLAGPAAAINATLGSLKQDDGPKACISVAWMPASAVAASPRPFVRLIGFNSSRWARGITEDRLLPDHIIATRDIDPLPVNVADRRDFGTILATTAQEVVLSRARRDSEGRLLGRSPLLAGYGQEAYLPRHTVPAHAFSETDRLMARPAEFALSSHCARSEGKTPFSRHQALRCARSMIDCASGSSPADMSRSMRHR